MNIKTLITTLPHLPGQVLDLAAQLWLNWHAEHQYRNSPDFEEVKLLRSEIKPGDWRFDMQHSIVGPMCEAFADLLDSASAKNHLQFDLFPKVSSTRKPVRITVQWAGGLSPSRVNAILREAMEQIAADGDSRAIEALTRCRYEIEAKKNYGVGQDAADDEPEYDGSYIERGGLTDNQP